MSDWVRQEQRFIMGWVGELFRARSEHVTLGHLPERWIHLIQYLNEQERERDERQRSRRIEQT